MQQRHIVSLLQEGYTTINVRFYNENEAPQANEAIRKPEEKAAAWAPQPPPPIGMPQQRPAQRLYTYKALLEDGVKAGDTVVVEVARGLVLVTVESVDESPRIDVDSNFDYRWIVDKVDMTGYQKRLQSEENFRIALQEIERKKQQERIKAELLQLHADSPEILGLFNSAVKNLSNVKGEDNAES